MTRLTPVQTEEKNRLESENILLEFLEITYQDDVIRIVKDSQGHTWRGVFWTGGFFTMDGLSSSLDGDSTVGKVAIPNVDRFIGQYFEETKGVEGGKVTYLLAFSNQLEDPAAILEMDFSVSSTDDDETFGYLNLGHSYALNSRRPERIHLTNTCDHQYGSLQCGLPASIKEIFPTCGRTLKECRARGNSRRFGGEPAIPIGGAYVT